MKDTKGVEAIARPPSSQSISRSARRIGSSTSQRRRATVERLGWMVNSIWRLSQV